jgi:hypothetical protein
MTAAISILRNQRGDDEAHMALCQHLSRLRRYQDPYAAGFAGMTHTADDLRAAIREADSDMAAAFGQTVYQPNPSDQPWTVSVMAAPCLRTAMQAAGLRFDTETGEAVDR